MSELPRRGELWWADTDHHGRRPVLLLTRDTAIPRLRRSLASLGTTTIRGLDSEVLLEPGDDPVPELTAINLDSIESVAVSDLVERMGSLSD